MPEYRKFTKDVGIVGISQLLMRLKSLILLPILAKTLGASDYGIWATLMVTVELTAVSTLLGLTSSMIRFLAGERDKREIQEGFYSIGVIIFFSSLFLSLLVFIVSDILASVAFGNPNAADIIKIGAFLIFLQAMNWVNLDFFRTFRMMAKWSFFTILQTIGEVLLAAYFILNGFSLIFVVYSFIFVRFITFLISLFIIIKRIKIRIPNFKNIKPYLLFGLPLVPTSIFLWIINSSDRYVIGYFMDSYAIGVYSAAYGISAVIAMFIAPIQTALFPTISKIWEENKIQEVKNHLKYSLKYFLLFAIPAFFGLTTLAEPILRVLTRPEFVTSGSLVIPFVSLSILFNGVYLISAFVLTLSKKTKLIPLLLGFAGVINIILNIILVPQMGILGAAISTLVSFSILAISITMISSMYLKFDIPWTFIIKSVVSSSIMSFIILWLNPLKSIDVLISIVLGAGIYFSILIALKGFGQKEVEFFRSIHKS